MFNPPPPTPPLPVRRQTKPGRKTAWPQSASSLHLAHTGTGKRSSHHDLTQTSVTYGTIWWTLATSYDGMPCRIASQFVGRSMSAVVSQGRTHARRHARAPCSTDTAPARGGAGNPTDDPISAPLRPRRPWAVESVPTSRAPRPRPARGHGAHFAPARPLRALVRVCTWLSTGRERATRGRARLVWGTGLSARY